jgi:hypothetical protein
MHHGWPIYSAGQKLSAAALQSGGISHRGERHINNKADQDFDARKRNRTVMQPVCTFKTIIYRFSGALFFNLSIFTII